MRTTEELVVKALQIIYLVERCGLESPTINGKQSTLKYRKSRRIELLDFLVIHGYTETLINEELSLLNSDIKSPEKSLVDILWLQQESLEPCLWAAGLAKELTDYNSETQNDYRYILQTDHIELIRQCRLRSERDVAHQRDIAKTWWWRWQNKKKAFLSSAEIVTAVSAELGGKYGDIAREIMGRHNDFLVNFMAFPNLSSYQLQRTGFLAHMRLHAFEWILGNRQWRHYIDELQNSGTL